MNLIKCDNCGFEVDVEKDPEELDEIWCDDCEDYDKPKWTAVICTKCYNKSGDLEIWKTHVKDIHIQIDIL